MARILIIFATREGHTGKIAHILAEELKGYGHSADVFNAAAVPDSILPEQYDAFVAGGPVYASKYPYELGRWIRQNSLSLFGKPAAFFSVCLGILERNDLKAQEREREIVDDFFHSTGWHPKTSSIFPGALLYSHYGLLKRLVMKMISRRSGGDTDTHRDYEYTDWEEVSRFANRISGLIQESLERRPLSPAA